MSVMNVAGEKILLPRSGPDAFWQAVDESYAGDDRLAWRRLAMLALREDAGWTIDRIAITFGQHNGHVSRCLNEVKRDLRARFFSDRPKASRPEARDQRPDEE